MGKGNAHFLTLDFGTESVRGAIFDDSGKMIHTVAKEYKTYFPHPGWAEQKPEEWWESFIAVVRKMVRESSVPLESILSMAIDTTSCTVLALDKHFRPLRNAIIWMDVRSYQQANRIAESGMEALKYNGFGSVSAEWMPCKALWLKENEPDTYNNARYICGFEDWINYQLTGEYVGSINNTTMRWYYNNRKGGWPVDFYNEIGLSDVIDKFPKMILGLGKPIGTIKPEVASTTGLSKGRVSPQSRVRCHLDWRQDGRAGNGRGRTGRRAPAPAEPDPRVA